jgi:hypothetical protein
MRRRLRCSHARVLVGRVLAVRVLMVVIVLPLVVVAGCGGGSSDATASKDSGAKGNATKGGSPPKQPDPTDACQYIVAGTESRSTPAPGDGVPYLVSAVAEPTTCYDKVSFVFDEGDSSGLPPGYTVEYRKKPFDLPPGITTSTAGFKDAEFVLYVELMPAATEDVRNPRRSVDTYLGNLRLLLPDEIQHVTIVEWVDTLPDVTPEDQTDPKVVWLIGLDEKRPFTVDFASQPPRVNVLIMN